MTSQTATPQPAPSADPRAFKSFAEFYPFYLSEHSNRTCRRLHFVGSTLSLLCLGMLVATGKPQYLLYGLLCGYGFAWVGHFGFEKNKPASAPKTVIGTVLGKTGWLGAKAREMIRASGGAESATSRATAA